MIKKRDVILIASILVVAIVLFVAMELTRQEGAFVLVRVDGQEVGRYALSEDGAYALNGGTNVLRIEDGTAYMTEADCPDKLCVHQGRISKSGQVITCLPNKLTVTVRGAEGAVDLIS